MHISFPLFSSFLGRGPEGDNAGESESELLRENCEAPDGAMRPRKEVRGAKRDVLEGVIHKFRCKFRADPWAES